MQKLGKGILKVIKIILEYLDVLLFYVSGTNSYKEKNEFEIKEIFSKEKPNIKLVIQEVFKSYIKEKLNVTNDLNYKK